MSVTSNLKTVYLCVCGCGFNSCNYEEVASVQCVPNCNHFPGAPEAFTSRGMFLSPAASVSSKEADLISLSLDQKELLIQYIKYVFAPFI